MSHLVIIGENGGGHLHPSQALVGDTHCGGLPPSSSGSGSDPGSFNAPAMYARCSRANRTQPATVHSAGAIRPTIPPRASCATVALILSPLATMPGRVDVGDALGGHRGQPSTLNPTMI